MATRYDHRTGKWVEGLYRHWYEYDWWGVRDTSGRPKLDHEYVNPNIPITEEEEIG